MLAVRIEGTEDLNRLMRDVSYRGQNDLGDAIYDMSKITSSKIRTQLLLQQKLAPRNQLASRIRARRLSKRKSAVYMPLKAVWLDSMRPHYVALRRGRQVTQWVNRYYGAFIKTGLSRVFRRYAKTGVKTRFGSPVYVKGFLYVTPDPFVDTALLKARKIYGLILRKYIRRTLMRGRKR